jgi:hypothetical protein
MADVKKKFSCRKLGFFFKKKSIAFPPSSENPQALLSFVIDKKDNFILTEFTNTECQCET